jgi:hypothetical protein
LNAAAAKVRDTPPYLPRLGLAFWSEPNRESADYAAACRLGIALKHEIHLFGHILNEEVEASESVEHGDAYTEEDRSHQRAMAEALLSAEHLLFTANGTPGVLVADRSLRSSLADALNRTRRHLGPDVPQIGMRTWLHLPRIPGMIQDCTEVLDRFEHLRSGKDYGNAGLGDIDKSLVAAYKLVASLPKKGPFPTMRDDDDDARDLKRHVDTLTRAFALPVSRTQRPRPPLLTDRVDWYNDEPEYRPREE